MTTTKIEWAQRTWQPVIGCTPVTAGCENCYAAREASGRLRNLPQYRGLADRGRWTGEVRLRPEVLDEPTRWRKPRRVFVCPRADLFHEKVPFEFIDRVLLTMTRSLQHQFLLLTKRPRTAVVYYERWLMANCCAVTVPENVWLGVSMENPTIAAARMRPLIQAGVARRYVSFEPALGSVNWFDVLGARRVIDWLIVGGESGPGARECRVEWIDAAVDACKTVGVPIFVKQTGTVLARELGLSSRRGDEPSEWPIPLQQRWLRQYPAALDFPKGG